MYEKQVTTVTVTRGRIVALLKSSGQEQHSLKEVVLGPTRDLGISHCNFKFVIYYNEKCLKHEFLFLFCPQPRFNYAISSNSIRLRTAWKPGVSPLLKVPLLVGDLDCHTHKITP